MNVQQIINYLLNKFCPFLIIGFLVFAKFGFETWEPYLITGLMIFIAKFSGDVGYAVGFCESNGIEYKPSDSDGGDREG